MAANSDRILYLMCTVFPMKKKKMHSSYPPAPIKKPQQ